MLDAVLFSHTVFFVFFSRKNSVQNQWRLRLSFLGSNVTANAICKCGPVRFVNIRALGIRVVPMSMTLFQYSGLFLKIFLFKCALTSDREEKLASCYQYKKLTGMPVLCQTVRHFSPSWTSLKRSPKGMCIIHCLSKHWYRFGHILFMLYCPLSLSPMISELPSRGANERANCLAQWAGVGLLQPRSEPFIDSNEATGAIIGP